VELNGKIGIADEGFDRQAHEGDGLAALVIVK